MSSNPLDQAVHTQQQVLDVKIHLERSEPVKPNTNLKGMVSIRSRIRCFEIESLIVAVVGYDHTKNGKSEQQHCLLRRFQDCTPDYEQPDGLNGPYPLQLGVVKRVSFCIPIPSQSFCDCCRIIQRSKPILPPTAHIIGERTESNVTYEVKVRIKGVEMKRNSFSLPITMGFDGRMRIPQVRTRLQVSHPVMFRYDKSIYSPQVWSFFKSSFPTEHTLRFLLFTPARFFAGMTSLIRVILLCSSPPSTFMSPATNDSSSAQIPDGSGIINLRKCSINMDYELITNTNEVISMGKAVTAKMYEYTDGQIDLAETVPVSKLGPIKGIPIPKEFKKMYGMELKDAFKIFPVPKEMVEYMSCSVGTGGHSLNTKIDFDFEKNGAHHQVLIRHDQPENTPIVDVIR